MLVPKDFDIVYGVIGTKASGKGEFGDRLNAQGFVVHTLSAPIMMVAQREVGPKPTVFDLIRIGNEGRRVHGSGYWAGETLQLALRAGQRKVVIDGIRNPGEIARLRELAGTRLVLAGITAPALLRFQRMLKRAKAGDPKDIQGFLEMDDKDRGVGQPDDGQHVDRCMGQVPFDNVYDNRGTLKDFHAWIDGFHAREARRVQLLMFEETSRYID